MKIKQMTGQEMKVKSLLEEYSKDKQTIHITMTNGNFINGEILELRDDKFIFLERLFGKMYIFYSDVKHVVPWIPDRSRE